MEKNELFETMPIKKAVMKMSIPLMTSLLVTVIYNMADTFFIGQTGDANQVAAVSLTTPIFMLLMALSNVFGMGGSALISRTLGAKDTEGVKHISSFCFYSSIFLGIICILVLNLKMEFILKILGTSALTKSFCKEYLLYYIAGAPFVLCTFTLGNVVRSEGYSKEAMIGNMIGTFLNIILDPIMILFLGMGVKGAALATVIGNISSVIYFVYHITTKSSILSLSIKDFMMSKEIIKGVMVVGIPASINNILMSISYVFVNNYLKVYGDAAIAGMGIANKVVSLVTLLLVGFAAGAQPIMGYSYGAKNNKRLGELLRFLFKAAVIGGFVGGAIIFIFANAIVRVFIDDVQIVSYGTSMLRALMISSPVVGIIFVLSNLFQAMGKGTQSMVLAVGRQGIIFIPVIYIMSHLLGLKGIIISQALTDILTAILAISMFINVKRKENLTLKKEVKIGA